MKFSPLKGVSLLIFFMAFNVCYAIEKKAAPWVGVSLKGESCQWNQGAGPWDYTNAAHRQQREYYLIEAAHFNGKVEYLRGGAKKSHDLAGDLDYTLRGIPNHHRALKSMMLFQRTFDKGKNALKRKSVIAFECYMQRAINFSSKDAFLYLLYASFLKKSDELEKGVDILKQGENVLPENAYIQYHLALLLMKNGESEEAVKHAKAAYRLGNPPKDLKNKLEKKGLWKD
jgi:tetratricopeptide (TPR) repeat protein